MGQRDLTQGSMMRHVVTMSLTSTVGILAMFGVDLADLFYLSLLNDVNIIAGIGFAGTLLFFTQSISIGLSIAMLSLVSRELGKGNREEARNTASNVMIVSVLVSIIVILIAYPLMEEGFVLLGAKGKALEYAHLYMGWILPFLPAFILGGSSSAIIRSLGDAKRGMWIMLLGALVNFILDPIFIFALNMGIEGAAIASVCSRLTVGAMGLYWVVKQYDMIAAPNLESFKKQWRSIVKFATPTTLTNFATPIGGAILTYLIAQYGSEAVAGMAIVNRITPVAFAVFFSLSGSVGPIIGQNVGAGAYGRVRETLTASIKFAGVYTLILWAVMALLEPHLVSIFRATGVAEEIVRVFCTVIIPMTFAMGLLFVANAAFNNLGHPGYATIANFARNTLGVVPFALLGGHLLGAPGVLIGHAAGGIVFGLLAMWFCLKLTRSKELYHNEHQ